MYTKRNLYIQISNLHKRKKGAINSSMIIEFCLRYSMIESLGEFFKFCASILNLMHSKMDSLNI